MLFEKRYFIKEFKTKDLDEKTLKSIWKRYKVARKNLINNKCDFRYEQEKRREIIKKRENDEFWDFIGNEYARGKASLVEYYNRRSEENHRSKLDEESRDNILYEDIKYNILKNEVNDVAFSSVKVKFANNKYANLVKNCKEKNIDIYDKLNVQKPKPTEAWKCGIMVNDKCYSLRNEKEQLNKLSQDGVIIYVDDIKYFDLIRYLIKEYMRYAEQDVFPNERSEFCTVRAVSDFVNSIIYINNKY